MPGLNEIQKSLAALRASRDAAGAEARALGLRAEALKADRMEVARTAGADGDDATRLARLDREIERLEGAADGRRAEATRISDAYAADALELVGIPLDDRIGQLDDHVPFLLFPVRLETKFERDGGDVRLRVRIFPDDVLISTHDPLLSEAERAAGVRYWEERAAALALTAGERRTSEHSAWSGLSTQFGGPRARYVARLTKPAIWPPQDAAPAPPPVADNEAAVRLSYSSAPARARLMPDQFIVMAFDAGNNVVAQAAGLPIPDTLMLGPDPESPVAELLRDPDGRLAANPKLDWLFNYERAVEVGMAVTLPVAPAFAQSGFRRVIAIGVKAALDPDAGAAALETLFEEHQFTSGIDILPQGSPTNNTDGAASAFSSGLDADEATVAQETNDLRPTVVVDHAAKGDAQRLAEALGISFDSVRDWPGALDAKDISDALAMNRALAPATIGTYLSDMVGTRMSDPLKAEIERYFLTYVTGRGLLPAIRIGAQPYGLLATSDLSRWIETPVDGAGEMASVLSGLIWLRRQFDVIAGKADPSLAQLGRGADSIAMSLRVIGQLASSASFAARKAVTDEWAWNTLAFEGAAESVRNMWWSDREAARNDGFSTLGLDPAGLPVADLFFFDAAAPIDSPLVDDDPRTPLSETAGLSKFDGTNNYIDWLLAASEAELRGQLFKDAQGQSMAAPRALLYRLLHHAWSTSLSRSAGAMAARLRPDLVADHAFSSLINIGADKVVPDAYATQFDAARLRAASAAGSLGDLLLDVSQGAAPTELPPEALPLQSQRAALSRLAARPTAVLERLLAEHVDLTSHRLDAWLTGLAARRLDHMRRRPGRARGLYVGAYGYVEDLVPKPARPTIADDLLPGGLRGEGPVSEQAGNGGFVHAPSLNQAVTAAILRNAYLTHAEPANRAAMSVNLTSRRVREAMRFIDGMRGGQELAVLLGYQFERGLHENHPNLELDEFIYVLRARFPLVSRRLTPVPQGAPAEVIEARNVVDGYDFLDHIRRNPVYPHGIAGLPPAGAKADAVRAEIDRLDDTLDAISDLMLAESVHQALQSNIDRARGVIGAIADGEMPPVPDVVQTPRSGRVVAERVALHLPPAGTGWTSAPTPRARANPRLNSWLAVQLPPPHMIGLEVRTADAPAQTVTLATIGLEPIDVVLMSADRLGDGSSELERFIADHRRAATGIEDDVVVRFAGRGPQAGETFIVIDASAANGATPLLGLLPQLRALRRTIGAARGLHAQDYRLARDHRKAEPGNPKGYKLDGTGDLDILPARLGAAAGALGAALNILGARLDALADRYRTLADDPTSFDPAAWAPSLLDLRTQLRALALFGAPDALPRSAADVTAGAVRSVYEQARFVLGSMRKRLERAASALALLPMGQVDPDPIVESRRRAGRLERRLANLSEAGREALGSAFPVQPVFAFSPEARIELEALLSHPIESDPLAIETWLQSLARVRPRMADLALLCAAAQWRTGREPRAVPIQLPLRAGDPWIGASWTSPPQDGEIMSVLTLDAPASVAGDLEGLLIDEWTETIPTKKETTGLAFHFDRPGATAPHALLLAAPPNPEGRWRWSELVGVVLDTFELARLRAIEPDLVAASPLFQLLPTTLMPFFHGDFPTSISLTGANAGLARE